MKHYSGWYFCSRSNWDGDMFDVRNLVAIERRGEDFEKLVHKVPFNPLEPWKMCDRLNKEVYDWLVDNVKDERKALKGWCCGNDEYNSNYEDFSLFFYRRGDALSFIKTWSVFKKPTETFNQNTYVKKVLDKTTNTLKVQP